jgi:integrase
MPKTVMLELEAHVAEVAEAGPDGVLFTAPRGGPLRRAELSAKWTAAVAAVGAPEKLHIHDLRPHAATSMARIPG